MNHSTFNIQHSASRRILIVFGTRPEAIKIENELGWKADENFDTGIVKTVEWYFKKNQ